MTESLLEAIEIETGPNPTAAVIWMHGLGDDGRGWSEVVPALGLPPDLAIRFIFPHAPVMPVTINNGMRMRAGYDIRQANLSDRADLDGVRPRTRSGTSKRVDDAKRPAAYRRAGPCLPASPKVERSHSTPGCGSRSGLQASSHFRRI